MATEYYVAELIQYAQRTGSKVIFEEVSSEGPDHEKTFTQRVVCNGEVYPEGVGRSKMQAKHNAAEHALRGLLEKQPASFEETDFKGILNDYCQKKRLTHDYIEVKRSGRPHSLQFTYKVVIEDKEYTVGEGKTIKQAQQNAAQQAWSALQEQSDWDSKVSLRSNVSEDDDPPMMSSTSTSTSTSLEPTMSSSQSEPMSTSDSIVFMDSSNPLNDQASLRSTVSESDAPTPSSLESAEPQSQSMATVSNDSVTNPTKDQVAVENEGRADSVSNTPTKSSLLEKEAMVMYTK